MCFSSVRMACHATEPRLVPPSQSRLSNYVATGMSFSAPESETVHPKANHIHSGRQFNLFSKSRFTFRKKLLQILKLFCAPRTQRRRRLRSSRIFMLLHLFFCNSQWISKRQVVLVLHPIVGGIELGHNVDTTSAANETLINFDFGLDSVQCGFCNTILLKKSILIPWQKVISNLDLGNALL